MLEEKTQITEVTIIPIKPKENGLVALASCVVDNKFYLGSIGVFTNLSALKEGRSCGYRITYPTKRTQYSSVNLYHPITKECNNAIEKAIVERYEELMSKDV